MGEAVALPLTEEAEGEVRRIALAPRLTPHVRHLAKYVDLPVPAGRAFVFWLDGTPDGHRAGRCASLFRLWNPHRRRRSTDI